MSDENKSLNQELEELKREKCCEAARTMTLLSRLLHNYVRNHNYITKAETNDKDAVCDCIDCVAARRIYDRMGGNDNFYVLVERYFGFNARPPTMLTTEQAIEVSKDAEEDFQTALNEGFRQGLEAERLRFLDYQVWLYGSDGTYTRYSHDQIKKGDVFGLVEPGKPVPAMYKGKRRFRAIGEITMDPDTGVFEVLVERKEPD